MDGKVLNDERLDDYLTKLKGRSAWRVVEPMGCPVWLTPEGHGSYQEMGLWKFTLPMATTPIPVTVTTTSATITTVEQEDKNQYWSDKFGVIASSCSRALHGLWKRRSQAVGPQRREPRRLVPGLPQGAAVTGRGAPLSDSQRFQLDLGHVDCGMLFSASGVRDVELQVR